MEYDKRHAVTSKFSISIKDLLSILSRYNDEEMVLLTAEIFDDMSN